MVLCEPGNATKRSHSCWDKPLDDIENAFKPFHEPTICTTRSCEKDQVTCQCLLDRYGVFPEEFVIVCNSIRSDVLPVTEVGGRAVHVPYEITWEHEYVVGDLPDGAVRAERLLELLLLDALRRVLAADLSK